MIHQFPGDGHWGSPEKEEEEGRKGAEETGNRGGRKKQERWVERGRERGKVGKEARVRPSNHQESSPASATDMVAPRVLAP